MNNRGWIKIIEAFIAVMLIAIVLLIVINQGYIGKSDSSSKFYDLQLSVLREIELNNDMRVEILFAEMGGVSENNAGEVYELIESRIPDLECDAIICGLNSVCAHDYISGKEIYAQSVAIAMTLKSEKLRQLKLFCWKE